MTSLIGRYQAHTNIALIKYWGKRNEDLILPVTNSLSLTLQAFYAQTQVEFRETFTEDQFTLNGQIQDEKSQAKISRFLDRFRTLAGCDYNAQVISNNFVPTAAGLASSSSAFAALTCACNQALSLELDSRDLSIMARQGSGSASRSLYGGLVEWKKGEGDHSETSFAQPIDPADWGLAMLVILVNRGEKKISSRQGMRLTMETSPFYNLWPQTVAEDLEAMKEAIVSHDIDCMGQVMEHNAMKMHATMLAANPSFTYLEGDSIRAIQAVKEAREAGYTAYYTMDAGPNVKILCPEVEAQELMTFIQARLDDLQIIHSGVGPGPFPIAQLDLL